MALNGTVGSYTDFNYTGAMQSVTIPADGIYFLQCYGPGGGVNGGTGGCATGYKILKKGQVIYVGVGQCGGGANDYGNRFNGGRDGSGSGNPAHWYGCHPGAGCTHMATANGELATLSGNTGAVLIVAGGGGVGKTYSSSNTATGTGGNGGGESGTSGDGGAAVGTQTGGYGFGVGRPCTTSICGGGAGWYGGNGGARGGAGGSGYIGGVPQFTYLGTTYAPGNAAGGGNATTTNGWARIEMVRKLTLPVTFNGTALEKIVFNGTEITSLIFNGTKLF